MADGAMERLIASLDANTAALNKMIEMSGGKAAGASSAKASSESKPASGAKASTGKAGGKKKTTVDDIAEAFGAYLGIKDKAEREVRKANVKAIVDHFGVAKATEIDADDFDQALAFLQQYIDGEEPDFGDGDGGDEGDEALV